jgi:hypothetical protein
MEGYWDKYKHLRRVKPPVQPYTTGDQHPMLGHKILFGPVENPVLRGSHQSMDVVEHPVIATLRAEDR